MHFRGDEDGVHLVGDWPAEMPFWPHELGTLVEKGVARVTIKVQTAEGWALYRVAERNSSGLTLTARRIRRGRGKAA